jgi:hypothetical protein
VRRLAARLVPADSGHHAMDHDTGTRLASTFACPGQNRFLTDGFRWLGATGARP